MPNLPIIGSVAEAQLHDPAGPALVQVPGAFVQSVVWLVEALQHPTDDDVGKVVRALLKRRSLGGEVS